MRSRAVLAGAGIVLLVAFFGFVGAFLGGVFSFISLTEGPFVGEPLCYHSEAASTVSRRTAVAVVGIPVVQAVLVAFGLVLAFRSSRVFDRLLFGITITFTAPVFAFIASWVMLWAVRGFSINTLLGPDCVQEQVPPPAVSAAIGLTPVLLLVVGGAGFARLHRTRP